MWPNKIAAWQLIYLQMEIYVVPVVLVGPQQSSSTQVCNINIDISMCADPQPPVTDQNH